MGEDLAGLFGDASRVLAMALLWGFVAEDELCSDLSPHGDHMSVSISWHWNCSREGQGGHHQVRHQVIP